MGEEGAQPSPASAGPLPSFPGSSLGPQLTFLGWLPSTAVSSLCLTHASLTPAHRSAVGSAGCGVGTPCHFSQTEAPKPPLLT